MSNALAGVVLVLAVAGKCGLGDISATMSRSRPGIVLERGFSNILNISLVNMRHSHRRQLRDITDHWPRSQAEYHRAVVRSYLQQANDVSVIRHGHKHKGNILRSSVVSRKDPDSRLKNGDISVLNVNEDHISSKTKHATSKFLKIVKRDDAYDADQWNGISISKSGVSQTDRSFFKFKERTRKRRKSRSTNIDRIQAEQINASNKSSEIPTLGVSKPPQTVGKSAEASHQNSQKLRLQSSNLLGKGNIVFAEALRSNRTKGKQSAFVPFLREPELGQSWFSPEGPDPVFAEKQKNGTVYLVRLGDQVLLDCHVTALENNLVSWFQKDPELSSLQLLTVGFQTYCSDPRFSLDFDYPQNYRLRIDGVRLRDQGVFHCQIATHPPQVMWARLDLVMPIFRIEDAEGSKLDEQHHNEGSSIDLTCRVRNAPLLKSSVIWTFIANSSEPRILNEDISRGGIQIETWWETGVLLSNLSLVKVSVKDSGVITCSLAHELARLGYDSVKLHVGQSGDPEAVYHSQGHTLVATEINISLTALFILIQSGFYVIPE